jgi:hypothetical protein
MTFSLRKLFFMLGIPFILTWSWSIRFLQVVYISKIHLIFESEHCACYVQSCEVPFPYKV